MNVKDFISKYNNHPVLFIGTGVSLRYINNSYSWDGLLKKVIEDVSGNEELYLNIKSHHQQGEVYMYPAIAEDVENYFNKTLENDRNGKFKEINDIFFEGMKKGKNVSRFKIYLSKILSNLDFKEDMKDEIAAFKKIRKNISSIVTTNYDKITETIFEFMPLIGNDILLSNPYGSVYKIHGCVDKPESIIITENDYKSFRERYELIRAPLLSLFIHNPIIFLGYNLGDDNIKTLLKTIFSYVDVNSDISEKIRDNFLVVEYKKDIMETEVAEYDIVIEPNVNIKINKVKTDNFLQVYSALSDLHLPISALDVRKVQSIVGDIYAGTKGVRVYVTEDINSLNNNDKVLAIGSKKTIQYQYQTQKELKRNYFKIIEESDAQRISIIDKYQISTAQYFPIFGFLTINPSLQTKDKLIKIQKQKIKELTQRIEKNVRVHNEHNSLVDIENDDTIPQSSKNSAMVYAILHHQIDVEQLEQYLMNYQDNDTSDYNRLLVLYDYTKYGNVIPSQEMKK